MKFFQSKLLALFTLMCFIPSCAVPSHQFAHAVHTGNVSAAKSFHQPGYAATKFSVTSAPGKYSLPIQYAILQKNKPMAKFLVENGSPRQLNGRNLAYYCSYEGKDEIAHYFASIGEGSTADIRRAKQDLTARRQQNRRASAATALIGLAFLAAIMSGAGSSGGSSVDGASQLAAEKAQSPYFRSR